MQFSLLILILTYTGILISKIVHYDAFKKALRKDGLASLTQIQRIRDVATAKLFITHSDGFIAFEDTTCVPSLVLAAQGKILELGPGPGNQIQRYDPALVDFIYAVDPNPYYGDHIAAKLKRLDLQDKYKLLACGIEDSDVLRKEGVVEGSMDTVLSIQVLCSVKDVKSVMREVWKLLRPGCSFVFWEHERNKDAAMAVAQTCLNPAWSAFVGCSMNREIKAEILAAGEWENPDGIEVADDLNTCLPRIWGVLKKKA
ncbi:methyltransferase-like protein 7b [Diplodia corticola]|uniref:Methyltransferase-like protein 7b n=1 Tax=Diplodia corticola TaxID=236234 RepID=A0A1J9RXT0_9PEZI|nr:methyltransferase-like protein 7b [Diplodia corticola]OJD33175.1 methyltransferase-like protein 7b [Diplodia corticola]